MYVGGAGSGGTLYAVSESAGNVVWTASVQNGDNSSPAVTAKGVYVSYACEQAYDFDPSSGALIWHHATGCEGGGGRTAVKHAGKLYVRDDAGMAPAILDGKSGAQLGTYAATAAPAFDGDMGFYLSGATLHGVNLQTNQIQWSYAGNGNLTSAPIVANGLVYLGAADGTISALPETGGAPVWSTNVGAPRHTA